MVGMSEQSNNDGGDERAMLNPIPFHNSIIGTYFPAVSLYMYASASFNFGPDFKYPPKNRTWKPISELVSTKNKTTTKQAR